MNADVFERTVIQMDEYVSRDPMFCVNSQVRSLSKATVCLLYHSQLLTCELTVIKRES